MDKQIESVGHDVGQLADDARALLAATSDVAGERVAEARARLAKALDQGRELCGKAREKAIEGARATDLLVHQNPYPAIAVGVGLGAIAGYLLAVRCRCNRD
jgi:ElaB/YqjD/DUF883 family membrane-anchored ribosome-binding protein